MKKIIYYANFHSHLNYCSNILNLLPNSLSKQIFLLQKKAIRILTNSSFLAHTKPLFVQEGILPFKWLVQYNALLFMYDFNNLRLPSAFDHDFMFNFQNDSHYNLRNLYDFTIQRTKYAFLHDHPLFNFPRAWNTLPSELKAIGSRNIFAKNLKQHLFNQDFNSI